MDMPIISRAHRNNFETLLRAARNGALGLVSALDATTGEPRAVIAAFERGADGYVTLIPFGHLSNGNPFEEYLPPAEKED